MTRGTMATALDFDRRPVAVLGLGFIGYHLATRLADLGAQVTVLTRGRRPEVAERLPRVTVLEGDIRDPGAVRATIRGASAVFNVCGLSGAAASNAAPGLDLSVNGDGVLTVLETVRRWEPGAHILFAGSRLQFGEAGAGPVGDDHPQRPRCVYGIHKMAGEAYHRVWTHVHDTRTTTLRLSNAYGCSPVGLKPGYNILSHFVRDALEGRTLRIFAPGDQTRDYLHVSDAVEAFIQCTHHDRVIGEALNIGSGVPTRVVDAAHTIVRLAGRGDVALEPWPDEERRTETGSCVLDVERAWTWVGWRARLGLEEGLARTIADMREGQAR